MSAKLVELIETDELLGTGKEGDVFRRVRQWWTKEGELVVEWDDWKDDQLSNRLDAAESELSKIGSVLAAACPQFKGSVTRETLQVITEAAKAWWTQTGTALR